MEYTKGNDWTRAGGGAEGERGVAGQTAARRPQGLRAVGIGQGLTAACSALRMASGLFMMSMKLWCPIMDKSGKSMAMRKRA